MPASLPLAEPPQNLCILRLSALGDVTHAVPVLRAVQDQWPQTEVTWITSSFEHKLLSLIDGVRFITINKKDGWAGYRKLRQRLAGERFDVMLQMQTSLRANLTGACVSAAIKLGWDRYRARDFHRLFMTHAVPETRFEHQLMGHLAFAREIGLEIDSPRWDIPVTEEAAAFADEVLPGDRPILLIAPCSSHPARNWSARGYAEVADYAISKHGMAVVLSGGPSSLELALGRSIETAMSGQATNLIGRDTLPQMVAVIRRAALVLGPDSGPAHLANALGKPVIGLHASTWSRRSGPYSSLDLCVDRFAEAARKYRGREPEQLRWGTRIENAGVMDWITAADVIERLEFARGRLRAGGASPPA